MAKTKSTDAAAVELPPLATAAERAAGELAAAATLEDVEQLRVRYFGKSGWITLHMKALGQATPEQRPQLGQAVNAA
ncbi:MAG TPA: hypothetical protein PKC18_06830, partial [Lacipirellulaceae bacterium]|nr:hypothetical protein [Lacipirellulaceae bacterium]